MKLNRPTKHKNISSLWVHIQEDNSRQIQAEGKEVNLKGFTDWHSERQKVKIAA